MIPLGRLPIRRHAFGVTAHKTTLVHKYNFIYHHLLIFSIALCHSMFISCETFFPIKNSLKKERELLLRRMNTFILHPQQSHFVPPSRLLGMEARLNSVFLCERCSLVNSVLFSVPFQKSPLIETLRILFKKKFVFTIFFYLFIVGFNRTGLFFFFYKIE